MHFCLVVRDNLKILYIQINFFLLIKFVFAAFLSGLIVMWILFEKNGKNVSLGHIAFCIVVFQQISVYLWPAWRIKSEKKQQFDFILKAILLQFFKNHYFLKNEHQFYKIILK